LRRFDSVQASLLIRAVLKQRRQTGGQIVEGQVAGRRLQRQIQLERGRADQHGGLLRLALDGHYRLRLLVQLTSGLMRLQDELQLFLLHPQLLDFALQGDSDLLLLLHLLGQGLGEVHPPLPAPGRGLFVPLPPQADLLGLLGVQAGREGAALHRQSLE